MFAPDTVCIHPDQKHIERLKEGDSSSLEEWYGPFTNLMKRFIVQNSGNEHDARDIAQDVVCCVFKKAKIDNLILTCSIVNFALTIGKNMWLTKLNRSLTRDKKPRMVLTDETEKFNLSEDTFKDAEMCNLQMARKNLLERNLKKLGDSDQKLLQLCWSGLSMDEVAKQLNVTYCYVRKKKCLCMAKLYKYCQADIDFKYLKILSYE